MAIQFEGSGYSPEDFNFDQCDQGGMPEPGYYHAKVCKVESSDEQGKTPSENLSFQILTGTVAGQGGKQITEYLRLSGSDDNKTRKVIQRAMGWGKRLGVYTEADAKVLAPIEFEKAIGKECVIEIEEHSYEDSRSGEQKTSIRISYMGVWSLDHPDAPECPRLGKPGPKKPAAPAAGTNGKAEPAKSGSTVGKPGVKPGVTSNKPSAGNVDKI